jgi:hypothetical protein
MVTCHFSLSIVKHDEDWMLVSGSSAMSGFLAIESSGKTIFGAREKNWTPWSEV